jgi:hypothetical protein
MAERLDWPLPYKLLLDIHTCPKPSTFVNKLETGVKNGDCLPACFAALLECMHRGRITSRHLETAASAVRTQIVAWVKKNWTTFSVFQPAIPVHELLWLQHDLGASPEERVHTEEWGSTPESRLAAYSKICNKVYFSDTEMLIFASMLWERSIPILFRVWRVTGTRQDVGTLVHTVPDKSFYLENGVREVVVIDLAHTGDPDHANAHYKLINSASIHGLTTCGPKRGRDA